MATIIQATSRPYPGHDTILDVRGSLARLDAARAPFDLQLPGLRLHQLTGGKSGTWSVGISANWRVTFAFDGNDAIAVDYEDYH